MAAVPSYVNPPGSSSLAFAPRTRFTQADLAQECIAGGQLLRTAPNIDAAQTLWAFAGKESGFNANCIPRHEAGYCTGRYSEGLREATKHYGHAVHRSYGPWQLLWANSPRLGSPETVFADLRCCTLETVRFLNSEILGRQNARTLEEIADV